ncbi:MAG: hypothetical protein Q9160_007248 [Pyrenula sp. 1 TL-2023]
MSFGFSVGDLISCTKLAVATFQALKSAPAEFHSLSLEVNSLSSTLKALTEESIAQNSIIRLASRERQESLQLILDTLTGSLQKLRRVVLEYNGLADFDKRRLRERLGFVTRDTKGPREKLAVHISSLGIFLTSLTHSSLSRLENLVRELAAGGGAADRPVSQSGIREVDHQKASFVKGWNMIGEELWREGVRPKDMKNLEVEVTSYVRHLVTGGKPFEEVDGERQSLHHRMMGRQWQSADRSPVTKRPSSLKMQTGTVPTDQNSAAYDLKSDPIVEVEKVEKGDAIKKKDTKFYIDAERAVKRKTLEELRVLRSRRDAELKRLKQEQQQAVAARKAAGEEGVTESELISPWNVKRRSDIEELESLISNMQESDAPTAETTSAEMPEESVQYYSTSVTPMSPTDEDKADKVDELVKTFEGLFELDDHAMYNESSISPALEYNPENKWFVDTPSFPRPYQKLPPPAPIEAPSPVDLSIQPDLPSPSDIPTRISVAVGPEFLPQSRWKRQTSSSEPIYDTISTNAVPAPPTPTTAAAATALHTRLRRLSQARTSRDQHQQSELKLYAIPDSIASLRALGVAIYTCDSCSLPIEESYLSCSECDTKICDVCDMIGGSERKRLDRNCAHKLWETKSVADQEPPHWVWYVLKERDQKDSNSSEGVAAAVLADIVAPESEFEKEGQDVNQPQTEEMAGASKASPSRPSKDYTPFKFIR